MKQLTIVYQIKNQEHQTALLCAPDILRVSHNDSILELTKAATLVQAQQEEIKKLGERVQQLGMVASENRHRVILELESLLRDAKQLRKEAQIENERLKERIAHGDGEMRERISRQAGEIMELQDMLDSIGAGGVESLRKEKTK